jgi:hypothetical protein
VSTHDADQASEERADVERFLRSASLRVERLDPGENPPDFYAEIDAKRIAIEHTSFHRGGTERSALATWKALSEAIERKRASYPALRDLSLVINFKGAPGHVPPKSAHDAIADQLVSLLGELPLDRKELELDSFAEDAPALRTHVASLLISEGPQERWLWLGGVAGMLGAPTRRTSTLRSPRSSRRRGRRVSPNSGF